MRSVLCLIACAVALLGTASAAEQNAAGSKTNALLTRTLPDIEGKEVLMLLVEYPPGGASTPHRHDAHTFVYVLEGAVVMQVAGGQKQVLRAGETFYETPTDVHTVARNASATAPAKLLVFFVKDVGAPPLVPVHAIP